MGLSCHGCLSSKWIAKGKGTRKQSVAAALGDGEVFVHSVHGNVSADMVGAFVFKRCLSFQSIGAAGLLWFASVWSCATQQQGGLGDAAAKNNIMVLLNFMLGVAGSERTVQLVIDSKWTCVWPRPAAGFASGSVAVTVHCSDGELEFSELKHQALQCHNVVAKVLLHEAVKFGMKPNATKWSLPPCFRRQ